MKRLRTGLIALIVAGVAACDGGSDDATQSPVAPTATVAVVATPPLPTATVVVPAATLQLVVPPVPASVGSSVLVPVRVAGATNLAAFQFTPTFDAAALELINISAAGFPASTGRVPTCSLSRMDTTTTFFCVSGGAEPAGPSGDGELATIEFRALAVGDTQVTLEGIGATTPDATDIPLTTQPVTITVQ